MLSAIARALAAAATADGDAGDDDAEAITIADTSDGTRGGVLLFGWVGTALPSGVSSCCAIRLALAAGSN